LHVGLHVLVGEHIESGVLDRTGTENVDPDMLGFQIRGPGSRKRTDRGFGCAVDGVGFKAFRTRNRSGENDRAAINHQRHRLLHREQHTLDVDIEHFVVGIFGDGSKWREFINPGIGKENVDPALGSLDRIEQMREVGDFRSIRSHRHGLGTDRFHCGVQLSLAAADDAFVRDVEQGLYFDPAKMHVLNHKGKYLSVRGPLNIARPVQGWPVIVQAGASDDGRQLAAETAEAVFTGGGSLGDGQRLYADIKGRMDRLGRDRDHLKILPGAFVVVGDSIEQAREKRARLDGMVHYDSAIASLSVMLGTDASGFDPDGQLPPIPETNASKSGRQRLVDLAARDKLTVRQLAQRVGGYGGLAFVGTPATIADQMEEWLTSFGCDGFNIMFPFLPAGLDDFVDKVVPELQRREIFRREYEGRTLRENLGLPRPKNRFFEP
jgi:alkanesulfonate monooxygenase SsuD/methylene tetrahydromethanopterin reductase-like flavin-dependent oxidoreductase (luciferase family)